MQKLIAVLIILPFIIGPAATGGCSWRKSDFFVMLDKDHNEKLSFPEWHRYYGSHTHDLYACSRSDFYLADCDSDKQLTWREYYDFRFANKGICGELASLAGYDNRKALYQAMQFKEKTLLYNYFGTTQAHD